MTLMINIPKYLYIDDEDIDSLQSIINGLNDTKKINVELLKLSPKKTFEDVKDMLIKANDVDGFLIDLRLDGDGPNKLSFSAPTIAQDIITLSSRGDILARPIVLCSTEAKMRATYDADKSSHDLFDYKFEKSTTPNWEKFATKLNSLAVGYNFINNSDKVITTILQRPSIESLDYRAFERFKSEKNIPTSEYAHFVIKSLFHHPGILIKERVLAARLGVDIEKSGESWKKLRDNYFVKTQYRGAFSDGWCRYWSDHIISTFKEISQGGRLAMLTANERVEILKNTTKIEGLIAAEPIEYCKSSLFWTTCEGLKLPLDPNEGYKVYESLELKPWQEPKYLSFSAINSGRFSSKGLNPQSSELNRIELFKEVLKANKK